ncbi:MAG: glycosyltransferase family 4 protein [Bacteroidia bacterium]|nr:glycosyltransferase family 4 protein [Bacteroidia bacterium]
MHIALLADPAHFHTRKWASGLLAAGAQVTLFSFSDAVWDAAPCVRIEPRLTRGGRVTYASFLASGGRLRRALEAHRVDLLQAIDVTPYGVWAARSGFRPLALIAMGADILEYPPRNPSLAVPAARTWGSLETGDRPLYRLADRIRRPIFRHLVRQALFQAGLITADNLQVAHAVRDWFGVPEARIRLNRWGVEPALFEASPAQLAALRARFGIREGQRVVLAPRGLRPIYRGDLVLDAFEALLREGREEKFILLSAGYGAPEAWVARAQALAAAYPQFHFGQDLLDRADMCRLWTLTDVMVNIPVYDGLSNALTEARYAGVVPLVHELPAHREVGLVHGETAWYADPLDAARLADSLRELLADAARIKAALAPANRAWVQEHALLSVSSARFLEWAAALVQR